VRFGRRRVDAMMLATAVVCAALGALFATLGSDVTEGDLAGIDQAVREFAQAHRSPTAYAFFETISALGSKPLFVAISVMVGWLISNRSKALALLLVACGILSRKFVHMLKGEFGVTRPPLAHLLSLSFPSGHVAGSAAVAVLLSYASWRLNRWRRVVIPFCAALLALMAMSRVYLDKHWFSDTVGGLLVGSAIGLVACVIYEWTLRRRSAPARLPEPAVPPAAD
jgi:membrane-associated phospholipid phosphatase